MLPTDWSAHRANELRSKANPTEHSLNRHWRVGRARTTMHLTTHQFIEQIASAVSPDLVDDLHPTHHLPKEQGQHAHIQANVNLASDQIAALHERGQ